MLVCAGPQEGFFFGCSGCYSRWGLKEGSLGFPPALPCTVLERFHKERFSRSFLLPTSILEAFPSCCLWERRSVQPPPPFLRGTHTAAAPVAYRECSENSSFIFRFS